LPPTTPALVLCCSKAGLAVIRSLGRRGVPVAGLCYGRSQPAAASRHLPQVPQLSTARHPLLLWRPTAWHALAFAAAAVVALGHLANVSEFLYFQF
jgi:hypothetical protein